MRDASLYFKRSRVVCHSSDRSCWFYIGAMNCHADLFIMCNSAISVGKM